MRDGLPRGFVLAVTFACAACGPGNQPFTDAGTHDVLDTSAHVDGNGDIAPDLSSRDVQPIDVPMDHTLDPDASCASTSVMAPTTILPVDIIWLVDNSTSMAPAIDQVIAGLNDFAALISSRGFDYHVIMLSLRSPTRMITVAGSARYAVCIPPPLAGDSACGNGERFFQSSVDIRSTQPLEEFLGTLGQTAGYRLGEARGGEPWRPFLRTTATKTIVVVSDDNSRLSASDFEHFAGGVNPFNSNQLPPGILDPSWGGLFDGYTFDGLYGWGSDTDPSVRCRYSDGTLAANAGVTYTTLVTSTHGVRAHICDGASAWTPFFDSVATAVESSSRIACDVAIPPAPPPMVLDPSRINVVFNGTTRSLIGKVADAAACGTTEGWYYDNEAAPMRVILCPAACDRAQRELRGSSSGIEVQFGCTTVPG